METIQGEGGIYPAEEAFLKGVRALCDEHDILLILDEISAEWDAPERCSPGSITA